MQGWQNAASHLLSRVNDSLQSASGSSDGGGVDDPMFTSHLRSLVMFVSKKRKERHVSTEESHRVMEADDAGIFM